MTDLRAKLTRKVAEHETSIADLKARLIALDAGESKYNGAPCPHGHPGVRYVKHHICVHCNSGLRPTSYQEPVSAKPYNFGLPRKPRAF